MYNVNPGGCAMCYKQYQCIMHVYVHHSTQHHNIKQTENIKE